MKKSIVSLFTVITLLLCTVISAPAASASARLLNVYGDGMLFKQLDTAVIKGTGVPGDKIQIELIDSDNEVVTSSEATVNNNGKFTVFFTAPEGSFNKYSIRLFENGALFDTLENVVFGELWLASGQSNMQYPLGQTKTGRKMYSENSLASEWMRILLVPPYTPDNSVPVEPLSDISDALWITGEHPSVFSMSAVAYFFAEKLMEELNMPVGILNASLGGSSIRSWIPRNAIDNCPEVKDYLVNNGQYADETLSADSRDIYLDMSANFNHKIAALKDIRISGMIWYQGETDLMLNNSQYDKQFDLLQKAYTEHFSFNNGALPVIYTQIASFYYSDEGFNISDWNISYCDIQKKASSSRALITISDLPLTYLPEAGLIHPESKEAVGERMAFSASGLVYKNHKAYTAATPEEAYSSENSIYVRFSDVGDGLLCTDKQIFGFSVCGKDGIYVNADAEVVSKDTVRISSEYVTEPVGVAYAYGVSNQTANLYSSLNGEKTLPVSTFITEKNDSSVFWAEKPWTECESDKVWYTEDDKLSGYYDSWNGNNCEISFSEEDAFSGNQGLKLTSKKSSFTASPVLSYKNGLINVNFRDADSDYSKYSALSLKIRNNGAEDIVISELRFYDSCAVWYSPAVNNTLDCTATIPADGSWHTVVFDLNRVYHLGNECSLSYDSNKLKDIYKLEFRFSSASDEADISIDSIDFAPGRENTGTRYDVDIKNADNILEYFTALILLVFGRFADLFQ